MVEGRWRHAATAGSRADLHAIRAVDPDLVEREPFLLGSALAQVVAELADGDRALMAGHSPATEAAVLGLTGHLLAPTGKGTGILLIEDSGNDQIQPLP